VPHQNNYKKKKKIKEIQQEKIEIYGESNKW
jgi:hypothetical protein